MNRRVVVWFSCGATSAVAAKLALVEHGHDNVTIVYTDPGSEHPDNARFLADCAEWFHHEIITLKSPRYRDTWQVWEERRFLNSPGGALCTVELKKKLRMGYQRPDDLQVFGFDADETPRANRFRELNPEVDLWTPLIERGLGHADSLALIERAGIELPIMYRLGFGHANCMICVKGGIGYMNKVRREFPHLFTRMARLERKLGATCLHDATGPIWLDELDPDRGDYTSEPQIECSLLCALAEADIA